MEDIIAMLIPIVLFICIVAAIRIVDDNRLRRRLAETHVTEEIVRTMLDADDAARRLSTLKWGLVMVAVGLAFTIIGVCGLTERDPASYGLLIGAAGIGMLSFHVLSNRAMRRPKERS